jgi:20S proteasome subunit alpha 7
MGLLMRPHRNSSTGRALANDARSKIREYKEHYGVDIPGKNLAERVAGRIHNTTIYWPERPYGCCVVLSTYDVTDGTGLYMMRPNGELLGYRAVAVGKHRQGARTELEKIDFSSITVKDALQLIAMVLYKLHDDVRDKPFELEVVWQTKDTGYKVEAVAAELRDAATTAAKEAKARALMADSDDEE